jgi:hypothetical protein
MLEYIFYHCRKFPLFIIHTNSHFLFLQDCFFPDVANWLKLRTYICGCVQPPQGFFSLFISFPPMKRGLEWSWADTGAEAQSTLLCYSMIKSLYGKQITIVL